MKSVTVLGATGSIGVNTLDVIARHPGQFDVYALTANRDVEGMAKLCSTHRPQVAVMADADAAEALREKISRNMPDVKVLSGVDALCEVASAEGCDYVMAAIVGAAGLLPTLAAAEAGKRVMLANKEALVMAGRLFMEKIHRHGAELLPVDSEHNAIFQSLPADYQGDLSKSGVRQILLTASGGPFRTTPLDELVRVTPEQACAHPNWSMGRKISVDSATMMNKGLEVIEACWLFNLSPDDVKVVVHPQSVVHSLVEYDDGSIISQMGSPDMRTPIAYALAWPNRIDAGVKRLDLAEVACLNFENADFQRFPCLRLAFEAMREGGTASAIMNAANEVAVAAFLDQRIGFTQIGEIVEATMQALKSREATSLDIILEDDKRARECADEFMKGQSKQVAP